MSNELIPAREAARRLGTTTRTLKYWRQIGHEPIPYKIGARWKYNACDVKALVEAGRVQSSVASAVERQRDRL
jgi:predicted site-specific integrase-resolvase